MAFSLFSGGAPEYLVAGLGNPGKQYLHTRHNAGFLAVEYLSQQLHAPVKRIRHHALTGNAGVRGRRAKPSRAGPAAKRQVAAAGTAGAGKRAQKAPVCLN